MKCLIFKGKFNVAIADYDLCLKHRPDTYEAWKYRANAKFANGDVENSIKDYNSALHFEPEDYAVHNNCAIAYLAGYFWNFFPDRL